MPGHLVRCEQGCEQRLRAKAARKVTSKDESKVVGTAAIKVARKAEIQVVSIAASKAAIKGQSRLRVRLRARLL